CLGWSSFVPGFTERLVASYSIWQKIQTVSHPNLVTKCVWSVPTGFFPPSILYMTLSAEISTPWRIRRRIALAHDVEEIEDFSDVVVVLGDHQRVVGPLYFNIDMLHTQ